jgi:hypothetical protein
MSLRRDELEDAPDDEIEWLVIDRLIRAVGLYGDDETQYEFVKRLSPGLQMMWGTFVVDGEVNNGGFNQFFWNSSGQFAMQAIAGFRLIGAEEHAALVEEAVKLSSRKRRNCGLSASVERWRPSANRTSTRIPASWIGAITVFRTWVLCVCATFVSISTSLCCRPPCRGRRSLSAAQPSVAGALAWVGASGHSEPGGRLDPIRTRSAA